MRRGALLNDAQLSGMLPTSVAGGENAPGNWSLMAGFCGPGSMTLLGFLALIAPCGGSFGLPKLISLFTGVIRVASAVAAAAVVIVAAVNAPPTAVAANMSRLENIVVAPMANVVGKRVNSEEILTRFFRAIKFGFRKFYRRACSQWPRRRCVDRQPGRLYLAQVLLPVWL